MSYPYPGYNADARLPWEIELSEDRAEAKALTMVMEGKEKMFDKDKLEQMGGIDALSETVLESLAGEYSRIERMIAPHIDICRDNASHLTRAWVFAAAYPPVIASSPCSFPCRSRHFR